jgi:hypothetical protein
MTDCKLCSGPDALELPPLPNRPDLKRAICRDCLMTAALVFSVNEKQHPPEWQGEMNVPLTDSCEEFLGMSDAEFGAIERSLQTGPSIPFPVRGSHLQLVKR